MNEQTIILTRYENSILYMACDDRGPLEYQLFNETVNTETGNIYVCEIKNTAPGIESSFVNFGEGRTGFIKNNRYKNGQLVPLLLKRPGNKDKYPVFTDQLSISGMFTVITNANREFSISKKIDAAGRKNLINEYGSFFCDLEYGITLRTNSQNAALKDVLKEADELAGTMDEILANADKRTCGTLLYKRENEWISYCMGAGLSTLKRIITDDNELYEELNSRVIERVRSVNPQVTLELYNDPLLPLDRLYSVRTGIEAALNRKVWLKSGGFLYIEKTEALIAIDVNTGKSKGKRDRETTFYECNLEATDEICRQIRLRNLSGMIIIDYINMKDENNYTKVIDRLREQLRYDRAKTSFHDITALSLVELTRQKIRPMLSEQINKNEVNDG